MAANSDFVAWVESALYQAELALHNGDSAPRRALWSRNKPVSILGAWRNAYTAGLEHTSVSVNGEPGNYTLRVTQVYRREDGEWKVFHRHADTVAG